MSVSADPPLSSKMIAFLTQVQLFNKLDEQDLSHLRQDMQLKEYARGETIFREGDSSSELFIVMKGKVRIFKITPSGNETSIDIFTTGDVMGEFAAIDRQPRSATAQVVESCTLLQMSADKFREHLNRMPPLALGLIHLLVAKIRWTADHAATIAQYDAAGRLLHILLLYNERLGQEQVKGKRYLLNLGLNQNDLASFVGVRREWVNHMLHDWFKRGLIEYDAGKIIILDLPRVVQERDSRTEANVQQGDW
jgi:CRP/FNR family transcriptional regulator, cyclic AMP receptor protein